MLRFSEVLLSVEYLLEMQNFFNIIRNDEQNGHLMSSGPSRVDKPQPERISARSSQNDSYFIISSPHRF